MSKFHISMGTKEAAEYLGVSEDLLKKLRGQGEGPPYAKIGQRVVYRKDHLDAYYDSCLKIRAS